MGSYKIFLNKAHLDFFEVSSAIQKSIRIGDEETALYFAVEMFNSGYDEYVWKRLKIIASEDVGLAEPMMPATIAALYQTYNEIKKKKGKEKPERLQYVHAIVLLCRAKKSRLLDWYVLKLWTEHATKEVPIPDVALDMHNQRGRRMGRGIDHFYDVGTKLHPHAPQAEEERIKEEARVLHKSQPQPLFNDMVYQTTDVE